MVRMSLRSNSSALDTRSAPCSAADSCVRFSLQAITVMPKTLASAAIRCPIRPKPRIPSVLSSRSSGSVLCQTPSRVLRSSPGMSRATAMISAQASSTVDDPTRSVPLTVMPSSRAAARSIALFRMPVVTISRRFGNLASNSRGNEVRSRIATTTVNGASRSTRSSMSARWSVNADTRQPAVQRRPIRDIQGHTLVVVEDRDRARRHSGFRAKAVNTAAMSSAP